MRIHFSEGITKSIVRDGINKTVTTLSSRWRNYGDEKYYRGLCTTAVWSLLNKREEFENDEDLGFYLFGNRYTRNRVFWEVDSIIREDCGIKNFDTPQDVDLDKVSNILKKNGTSREILIKDIALAIEKADLTAQEECVISLLFDLSHAEERREDSDSTPWNIKELSITMELSEKEIMAIKKRALKKLKPFIKRYS